MAEGGSIALAHAAAPVTRVTPTAVSPPERAPESAPDAASAAAAAFRYGTSVEVLAERTESSLTFAQPDGSFRMRQSATPQRVRRGGGWVPVDPTLHVVDGAVVPRATTLDVRFSAGGPGPMLTLRQADRSLALSWPKPLPVPELSGDTATYREVLRGVDLKLAATIDSFSQVLVVKSAQAVVDNPELAALKFGVESTGLTVVQDPVGGVIRATDRTGRTVFMSDSASMWDTPTPAVTPEPGKPGKEGNGEAPPADSPPSESQTVPVTLAGKALTVTPSKQMLTDPATVFPVFIDPAFNGGKEIWTVVSRKDADRSFWTDPNMRDYMRVGQTWRSGSTDDWRTIVQFNTPALKGTQILSASVLVTVWHTADCKATPFALYRTNGVSTSQKVTWDNTKNKTWTKLRQVNATANKRACPKADDEVEFGDPKGGPYTVKGAFQNVADKGYPTITLGFRAPDEGDDNQWKKLKKDSAYLDVVYNRKPAKPTGLTLSPCDKNPCANPAKTYSNTPQLKMAVADADKGTLRYEFEVMDSAKKVVKAASGTTVSGKAAGSSQPWKVIGKDKKPLPDGTYYWHGKGCDSTICGPWSDWFGFTVDTKDPTAPKVGSVLYKPAYSGEPDAVPGGYGGPGVPGQFTFNPGGTSDGVAHYMWWLNGGKVQKAVPDAKGEAKTNLTPTREGPHTIRVYAVDAAGNRTQGETEYKFKVAPAGGQWVWKFDEGTGSTAGSTPVGNRPASIVGPGATWPDRYDGSALALDGNGYAQTGEPVLNTTAASGFTVAAWVQLPGGSPVDGAAHPLDPQDPGPVPDPEGPEVPTDDSDQDSGDTGPGPVVPTVPATSMTAVSQDGANTSMFRLGFRADVDLDGDAKPDPAWCFTLKASDAADAAETRACTRQYVNPGVWVHLVGVVDNSKNLVRLYVNGGPGLENGDPPQSGVVVEVPGAATWASTSVFAIGRGKSGGPAERWSGALDDVRAVPSVWSTLQIETAAATDLFAKEAS